MLTLADEVLALLPQSPDGLSVSRAATMLSADAASVRRAFVDIEVNGRALVAKRGKGAGLYLVPLNHPVPICRICKTEFLRPKKSKRVTCGRSCAVELSWQTPETRASRVQSIKAQRRTPEGRRKTDERNRQRWARPGEREKLAERNRKRWADPYESAKMAAGIRKHHRTPEARQRAAEERRAAWRDPETRRRMIEGIRKARGKK